VSLHARGRARLAWLDRFIVPRETPLAPSRWHQHIVQRRMSRLDHLRPHRLNWEALKHPEPAAGEEDETLTPRRLAGIQWSWLDGLFTTVSDNLYLGFIVLYALAYGASTSQLGLLAAIQNLFGAVSLFPERAPPTRPDTGSPSSRGPSAASRASRCSPSRWCRG
jgi:hypothetical protein